MYTPSRFRVTDINTLHVFMEQNSFATLLTNSDGIAASHLPLLLKREVGELGHLIGHMAKANEQWHDMDGEPCSVIFRGAHAYISASWYEEQDVVPTWNYVAVHAHGRIYLETQKPRILEILRQTTDFFEADMAVPWTMDQPEPEFIERTTDMVVGFRIEIDRLEGNWKLNQHHSAERKAKTIAELREVGKDNHLAIAQLMENAS